MAPALLLVVYALMILLASLVGGWIPLLVRLTHARMELAVSFVAGLMLGVAVLHLLPHAASEIVAMGPAGRFDYLAWSVLAGFLVMFFIERFFCYHHHDVPEPLVAAMPHATAAAAAHDHDPHEHAHDHGPHAQDHAHSDEDGHSHDHAHDNGHGHDHDLTWSGAAVGLTVHSLLEGLALSAAFHAESHGHALAGAAGLGTFLVILLHKPFDALTVGTLMARSRWPIAWRHAVNVAFALVVPLGAVLFYLGLAAADETHLILALALGLSAGVFLCIAASDLLPELRFHSHDRVKLSAALLAGLALAWAIGLFESHGHGPLLLGRLL